MSLTRPRPLHERVTHPGAGPLGAGAHAARAGGGLQAPSDMAPQKRGHSASPPQAGLCAFAPSDGSTAPGAWVDLGRRAAAFSPRPLARKHLHGGQCLLQNEGDVDGGSHTLTARFSTGERGGAATGTDTKHGCRPGRQASPAPTGPGTPRWPVTPTAAGTNDRPRAEALHAGAATDRPHSRPRQEREPRC